MHYDDVRGDVLRPKFLITFFSNPNKSTQYTVELVNLQCRGVLLNWIRVGQGPTGLAVGTGWSCLDIFFSSVISLFFLPLSGRRPDID